jgi:aquaporin Z
MTNYGATAADIAAGAEVTNESVKEQPGWMEYIAPYLAEIVGTFLIVFTMGCCSFCGDPLWNPTALACIVIMAVYSLASTSGAHLNPAITLALCISFKFPWKKMVPYMICQVVGAFLGSLGYWAIFEPMKFAKDSWGYLDLGFVEALYTFMIVFVFMNSRASVRNNKENDQNHFFALAIGLVYIAGGYATQDISGGILNPAASLAIGITGRQPFHALVYLSSQMLGGWLASMAFAIVRPEDFKLQYDGNLEDFKPYLRSKTFSEMLGTFLVVMTFGLNITASSAAGAWSTAAAYISMMYSLGDVSGGHFNPAVTLAAVMTRRDVCSIPLGQAYWLQQLLGGAAAGIVYAHYEIIGKKTHVDFMEPRAGYTFTQVAFAEVIFTAILCFAFLAVATTVLPPSGTKTNFYFAFAIGSCVAIGGFAAGPVSGGVLNPATALGVRVARIRSIGFLPSEIHHWWRGTNVLWYALYEMAGGAAAALVYALTHQKEYLKKSAEAYVP